jgi:hypothetical protein
MKLFLAANFFYLDFTALHVSLRLVSKMLLFLWTDIMLSHGGINSQLVLSDSLCLFWFESNVSGIATCAKRHAKCFARFFPPPFCHTPTEHGYILWTVKYRLHGFHFLVYYATKSIDELCNDDKCIQML